MIAGVIGSTGGQVVEPKNTGGADKYSELGSVCAVSLVAQCTELVT